MTKPFESLPHHCNYILQNLSLISPSTNLLRMHLSATIALHIHQILLFKWE